MGCTIYVLVTPWCDVCEEVELPEIPGCQVVVEDAEDRPDLALRYSVYVFPSFALVKDGTMVWLVSGLRKVPRKYLNITKPFTHVKSGEERLVGDVPQVALEDLRGWVLAYYDSHYGGFEQSPKQITTTALNFLLDLYEFDNKYSELYLLMVLKTFYEAEDYMISPRGGFYLYSRSRDWQSPYPAELADHNAEILKVLIKLFNIAKKEKIKTDDLENLIVKISMFLKRLEGKYGYKLGYFKDRLINREYLHVTANVLEALYIYGSTFGDKDALDTAVSKLQALTNIKSHRLDAEAPLYMIDLAHLMRALAVAKLNEEFKFVEKTAMPYRDVVGFFDITSSHAEKYSLQRVKSPYDNLVVAEAYILMGQHDEAERLLGLFTHPYALHYSLIALYGSIYLRSRKGLNTFNNIL